MDLASVPANDPKKEMLREDHPRSTGDAWGPGNFWMAAYSGELRLKGDQLVSPARMTTIGGPENYGLALLQRRIAVDEAKPPTSVALPVHPASESSRIHLLAATLNPPEHLRAVVDRGQQTSMYSSQAVKRWRSERARPRAQRGLPHYSLMPGTPWFHVTFTLDRNQVFPMSLLPW